ESDHRPAQWKGFREPFQFTGKEEDVEIGAVYFGARYYQPYLGRFMSADPLTVHGLASDLNPYAYVGGRVSTSIDPAGLAEACPPATIGLPPDVTTAPSPKPETPPPPQDPRPDKPAADAKPADSSTASKPPRDIVSFERGDPSAVQKPTRG